MTSKKDISSKTAKLQAKNTPIIEVDPTECPFREFRDSDLSSEYWGMGPAAFRAMLGHAKSTLKPPSDYVWVDEQTQPLPRSVRHYLHGWVRAEELALNRWESDVVIFEENDTGKMSTVTTQLSHAQVILRSSFCRRVLSICFLLENVEGFTVEHQWENFSFPIPPEGWRARYHIYSPGLKSGGGQQHRPGLSKNGCYLVRLFYLGAWRCVWVNDQVPVDATDSPLLPFSPLISSSPAKSGVKGQGPPTVTAPTVNLWPLLLCKALLKLAAPDMNSDEDVHNAEDERMLNFSILHALTGAVCLTFWGVTDFEEQWNLLISEVPLFTWDDDDDTVASTTKSKNTKKPTTKETAVVKRGSTVYVVIEDSKNYPAYFLPGVTPGHEMDLLVLMARDLPLKKPVPEPEVVLWKTYRWVDWARSHGLYEAYDCPRIRFLKVIGLLKLSHAPHLLDVHSTESITACFREENVKDAAGTKKPAKELPPRGSIENDEIIKKLMKEELREWQQFSAIKELLKVINIIYYPSMYEFTTAASSPPIRVTKGATNRALDIPAPKSAPLYLQIDSPDINKLRISLNMLHPRVLINSGVPILEYIEPAYVVLERLEWFKDSDISLAKGYVESNGYAAVDVTFDPGRHYCRIWVHSRMNWNIMLLSESTLLLGTRDVILAGSVKECPWSSRFLTALSTAFYNWIRINRSSTYEYLISLDRDFYSSYQPDLPWDPKIVGYDKAFVHWMFRRAVESILMKKMSPTDFSAACRVLRRYFCDPDFGFPDKPSPPRSLREIVAVDPCDCVMPEVEDVEEIDEHMEEILPIEDKCLVQPQTMSKLLEPPKSPIASQVCELATEELPCGLLKEEREKVIKKHEAATLIQAHWRGMWARKCLTSYVVATADVLKSMMDNAFGNLEALSALMNEFFALFPGAKYAYSLGSALTGSLGLQQHTGMAHISPQCKWIPYFQGVFYCHAPVKVHFDVNSTLQQHTVAVYDNDTQKQLPQVYNAHITFNFMPNIQGYTVMGHGTLNHACGSNYDTSWQLTILSSINNVFHLCDNAFEMCKELPLPSSKKFRVDEIFIPNRRNILGGIQVAVTRPEAISFRAAATSPELEMEAILRSVSEEGVVEKLATCSGTGELHWPYLILEPASLPATIKGKSVSHFNVNTKEAQISSRKSIIKSASAGSRVKSSTKIKDKNVTFEPKIYFIEVIASAGWPLTLEQWKRVDEIRNCHESAKVEASAKKPTKDKPNSGKEKDFKSTVPSYCIPQPGDAYVELECSTALGGGAYPKRDDERDLQFSAARRNWNAKEPGRNLRGAHIRKEFREEFLEALPPPPVDTMDTIPQELLGEIEGEGRKEELQAAQQGPSPASESVMLEMTLESEEEAMYLTMPEQLKDKFIPLYFIPLCTAEKTEEEGVIVTEELATKNFNKRYELIEASLQRMRELQIFNEVHVLGRQKNRNRLLENFFVDSDWCLELAQVLEERDDAIATEALNRTLSANKKKQEAKKK